MDDLTVQQPEKIDPLFAVAVPGILCGENESIKDCLRLWHYAQCFLCAQINVTSRCFAELESKVKNLIVMVKTWFGTARPRPFRPLPQQGFIQLAFTGNEPASATLQLGKPA